ncbi:MAG: hypothetical protein M1838_004335 [Thelocarpon superellum]|nr:MAG: hypothetical protein M1838_004335 [Thelocarpon superellum]
MPPKKATGAAPKKASTSSNPSYKDMIKDAIVQLKDRNGSSRQAIKKYVQANNKINAVSPAVFDSQFNRSLKAAVEAGDFTQPKGPSGPVKIAKKSAPAPAPKKPAATTKKPAAPKKAAAPKKTAAKPAAPKKAAAKPKTTAAKPKKAAAPAVTEKETVLGKTKSGRVTKTAAKPAAKKAAPKKAAPKKAAAPKKKAEPAPAAA